MSEWAIAIHLRKHILHRVKNLQKPVVTFDILTVKRQHTSSDESKETKRKVKEIY